MNSTQFELARGEQGLVGGGAVCFKVCDCVGVGIGIGIGGRLCEQFQLFLTVSPLTNHSHLKSILFASDEELNCGRLLVNSFK